MGRDDDGDDAPRRSDAELVARLREQNFDGPDTEALCAAVVNYALPILHKWQLDGTIHSRCRQQGRSVTPDAKELAEFAANTEAREDLIQEVLLRGWTVFHRIGLQAGHWQPGGRSLASYFVMACVREYPAALRHWRTQCKGNHIVDRYGVHPQLTGREPATSGDASSHLFEGDVRDTIDALPDDIRQIVIRRMAGWPYLKIGTELGISARAVEGRLRRFRETYGRET